MKGHKYLTRCDNAGDAQLHAGNAIATRDDRHKIVRAQIKLRGIDGIHLEPRIWNHAVELLNAGSLGPCVPVFDCPSGVEDEVVLLVRLLDKGIAWNAVQ